MCATGQDSKCPGTEALRLVGDQLADKDYEVSSPQRDGTHLLRVMNVPLALCEMTFSHEVAQWYYQPFLGHQGTAAEAAAMVTAILGPGDPVRAGAPQARPCNSHLIEVTDALRGSGLLVTCSDVSGDGDLAELAIDNPVRPGRGTVRITSDHAVIWDCRRGGSRIAETIIRALAAAS